MMRACVWSGDALIDFNCAIIIHHRHTHFLCVFLSEDIYICMCESYVSVCACLYIQTIDAVFVCDKIAM